MFESFRNLFLNDPALSQTLVVLGVGVGVTVAVAVGVGVPVAVGVGVTVGVAVAVGPEGWNVRWKVSCPPLLLYALTRKE